MPPEHPTNALGAEAYAWVTPTPKPLQEKQERYTTWWMRQVVALSTLAEDATIDITCLGYVELWVNGHPVSDEPLAPSMSCLDKRGLSIEYPIGHLLNPGENCIALWCSPGWYLPHQFDVHQGVSPLIGIKTVGIDLPASGWLCHKANRSVIGPWCWDKFGGEEIHAAAFIPGWNEVGLNTVGWTPAAPIEPPPIQVQVRSCPPNTIGESYAAQSIRDMENGRFEIDFGTCLTGWLEMDLPQLHEGQQLEFWFYDLPCDVESRKNNHYSQRSIYHAKGDGTDRFIHKFNYAGFRYVTVSGVDETPALSSLQAHLIETELKRTGQFRCSNERFNQIHDLNVHTLRCLNLGGYSVDCPTRERMGYGADGQTALPAYLYLMDAHSFLRKWLTDWLDIYEPDTGRIGHTAPIRHESHSPCWGGVIGPLAWALYIHYGDREALEATFPTLYGYLHFMQKGVRNGILNQEAHGGQFHADWVPPGREMGLGNAPTTPMRELFNTCFLIHLWELFGKFCRVLGEEDYLEEIEGHVVPMRAAVHRDYYLSEEGFYLQPEQAYTAMPLWTGVVPEDLKDATHNILISMIRDNGWHMDTGLPGTTYLLDLLMQKEEHEVISKIYQQETYPSWGFMVAQGATTIWEQWNGDWSQIHSCFAGPAEWFYRGLAGIRPDEAHPGYKQFYLAPAFVEDLDFVECSFDSPVGTIESSWKRNGSTLTWTFTVPEGSRALIELPDKKNIQLNGSSWAPSLLNQGSYTINIRKE